MTEEKFVFAEQEFIYQKEEKSWQLRLKRSDIATHDLTDLLLLNQEHPVFLKQTMAMEEDGIVFTYETEPDGISYESLRQRPLSERLRLALNVFELEASLDLPLTFLLHPSNLFINKDAQPLIAYRGLPEIMVPPSLSQEEFLRQAKCFTVALFSDWDFLELYWGALEQIQLPDFLNELRSAEDSAQASAILEKTYQEELKKERQNLIQVPRRQHRLFKLASIWLTAGVVLLAIPLIYLVFLQNPFKEKLLQADTAFIKVDYSGVITELSGIAPSRLPNTQKYELAYSYIQGLPFSDDQRKVILNNVTLKSDSLYLNYWIQIGRNQFEDALDTAKRINDSDLILYALSEEIKQVRDDDSLSGKDRETKLESLEGDYKKYWDSRSELLTDPSSSSGSEVSGASSEPASSSSSSASQGGES